MLVTFPPILRTSVTLPRSKSITARALLINALSSTPCRLSGVADCDDSNAMIRALSSREALVDVGAAGTAMRFLTAYYATRIGEEHILTGTPRMQQRPIKILVEALRSVGAEITYMVEDGFPPLRIIGKALRGGVLELPAHVSSQYVSALLMIAPLLANGLSVRLIGDIASAPYIRMTLELMSHFGIDGQWEGKEIVIPHGEYFRQAPLQIEADWSAASYWYEMMVLTQDPEAEVLLLGLERDSLQGDRACVDLFSPLGVRTTFTDTGVRLTKKCKSDLAVYHADLAATPDLAQAVVVACVLSGQAFHFSGLQSLKIKETDRAFALTHELGKMGFLLTEPAPGELAFAGFGNLPSQSCTDVPEIPTYDDHRMAMSFAPVAMVTGAVQILSPEVVCKSYPTFWDDLPK